MQGEGLKKLQSGQPISTREQLLLIAQLSWPAILAQISSVVMQYIDTAMVGQLGSNASAAIGVVATTSWLFGDLCIALTIGFNVAVAQALGARQSEKARGIMKLAFLVCMAFSLVMMAIALGITGNLPRWLRADPAIWQDASTYFLVFVLSLPFMQLNNLCGGLLRSAGNMKTPGICMAVMCLLDVVFNAFLIFPGGTLRVLGVTLPGFGLGVLGASMGTALTVEQTRLLSRFTKELVLCYDNDNAGKIATERALQILNGSEFSVKVLQLPRRLVDGEYIKQDADDFIKLQGPDAFERLLNGSENGVEFRMAQIAGKYDLKDDEARIAYCGEVSELLASLPGAVEREIYTGRAAEAAGITAEAMKLEVQRSFKRRIARENRSELRKNLNPAMALQPKERSLRFENMRSAEAEKGILRLLLTDDTLFSDTIPIPPERFSSPLLSRAYQRLWEVHAAGSRPMISSLGEEFSREEIDCLTAVCQEPVSTQHAQQALTDYIDVINSEADKRTAQDDPLLAAVEKFKNKKRGKQHV